jgi:hypothetical protein
VLLLIPLGIATYENWVRANHVYEVEIAKHRFNVSGTVMEGLPETERNWVIHRIAWLKGIREGSAADDPRSRCASVLPVKPGGSAAAAGPARSPRAELVIFPSMPGGFRLDLIAISLQLDQERLRHLG